MKQQVKKIAILSLSFLCAFAFASCSHGSPAASSTPAASGSGTASVSASSSAAADAYLRFKETSLSLQVYDASQIEVETNLTTSITYESSDSSIALISQSGHLFAKKAGSCTLKAKSGTLEASLPVSVTESAGASSDYVKVPSSIALALDKEKTLTLTPKYMTVSGDTESEITGKTFTYSSSDETIATVSDAGVVTALKSGLASITVTSGDVVGYVDAEIYDQGLSTTGDWLAMIANVGSETRYCLLNDIDFSGVAYGGYLDLGSIPDKRWTAELNGCGHHVSNVTMATTDDGHQSLFGQIMGGTIENIAFDNIIFNGAGHNSGLAGRIFKHNNEDVVCPTYLRNIALDCVFTTGIGTGLSYDFYGGEAENVFIQTRSQDSTALKTGSHGVVDYTTLWYGGSMKNVVAYTLNSDLSAIGTEEGSKINQSNVVSSSHKVECIYAAYSTFDSAYWDLSSNAFPTLKAN